MIRFRNVKIREEISNEQVFEKALNDNKIKKEDVEEWYIYKKSIDARKKEDIYYNYTIDIKLKNKKSEKKFDIVNDVEIKKINVKRKSNNSPVIIGAGPAGLFAALVLIENGIKPIIIERGQSIEDRQNTINDFIKTRRFKTNSNIQFGEGGAGTFSDGKLNSGNTNEYSKKVLKEFVKFGAPEEILYVAKPHLGTDNLVNIIKNIRKYILQNGGEIYFNEKLVDFETENNKVKAILTDKKRKIETDTVILAIGHSARDTFKMLYDNGVQIAPKNFAIGVRIEHLQNDINYAQYGNQTKLKYISPPF